VLSGSPTGSDWRSPMHAAEAAPYRRWRWAGPVAVFLALVFLGFGGYAVDIPLLDVTARPVSVGSDVRITPLSGWRVAQRSPGEGATGISFTRGGGNLQVVAGSFRGGPEELLAGYIRESLAPHTSDLAVSRTLEQVRLRSGLTGVRVAYLGASASSGAPVEGQVTAVVSPTGSGIVFNAWAPKGVFQFETGDVNHMIATAEVS
jgi:hypothetical protein